MRQAHAVLRAPRRCARLLHLVHAPGIMPAFRVVPIPLFSDNYAYRIENVVNQQSLLVDPADAAAALGAAGADTPELVGVLTTHHHHDHSGGNAEVARRCPGVEVFAGAAEGGRVPAATRLLADGERFTAAGLEVTALHTPCHTAGHVCYVVGGDPDRPAAVFTGDTLFLGGCGRFFEGDAATMAGSLAKLAALPPETEVYCGHEYTVANLRFGLHAEPSNDAIRRRLEACERLRAEGRPTVPSTIGEELTTNVFLRTRERAVAAFTHPEQEHPGRQPPDPVEVLARLREAKNAFKAA
jgi:hydroxyacylglutathione hydrolase